MIKKLGAVILLIIAIFNYAKFKGRQDEKDKQNKAIVQKTRETSRRRRNRANDTPLDDLKWLQEHNTD